MEPITVEWKHANKDRGREQPWHPCGILRCMSLARANPTFNSRHDMSVRLQVCANPVLEVHHKVLRNQCDWIPWNWPARQTFTKLWHALMLQCRKYQETWRNHVEGRSRLFKASAPHLFFRAWMGSILPKLLEVASERFLTLRCSDDANNWNWRHAMTSLNSRRQAVPKIFIFVCVWNIWRDVKLLTGCQFWISDFSKQTVVQQGACGHHAHACQRSYAWWWKPGLITLVYLLCYFKFQQWDVDNPRTTMPCSNRLFSISLYARFSQSDLPLFIEDDWFF